jgi:hypothetical protein
MTYKKQFTVLAGIIAALAVVYILTIVFDPERVGSRSAAYSWLEPGQNDKISGITIAKADETINLTRNGGKWFVSNNGKDYPARDMRIEDFIAALSKRAPYPVRSSSSSSHERLSLTDDQAVRVTVAAGAGLPLLNLLIGQTDLTGQSIYLRKQGQNEVRSGEDIFSSYTRSSLTSWYNLRLFPETESGKLTNGQPLAVTNVQRLTVYHPRSSDGADIPPQIFTRSGKEWTFNFELANPDMGKVDNYIRDILNTSGYDFVDYITPSDSSFNNSRIVLELGDGAIRTIRLGPPDEDGQTLAAVSGSDWVYAIPAWASDRFFAHTEYFETD